MAAESNVKGKQRSRAHVLESLSIHHVEGIVIRCGFTIQRVAYDYGDDLLVQTFNEQMEADPGRITLQLKATESLRSEFSQDASCLFVSRRRG